MNNKNFVRMPYQTIIVQTQYGIFTIKNYDCMTTQELMRERDSFVNKFELLRINYPLANINLPRKAEDIFSIAIRYEELKLLLGFN